MPRIKTEAERFWAKVNKTETCWLWTAAKKENGYGAFGSDARRTVYPHRWSYLALVGPIPAGLELDHLCRVRACVNPEHLELVTHVVNVRRASRATAVVCPRGHAYSGANLYRSPTTGARNCRACRDAARERWRERSRFRAAS